MEEEKEEKNVNKKLCEQVENKIDEILEAEGVNRDNIDYLGKLEDIHKDIKNEKYWKKKEEMYMYRDYRDYPMYEGEYDRGRSRDSMGRYREGSYGRRGVKGTGRGRYRDGSEKIDEMHEHYMNYQDGREEYHEGNSYNGEEQMVKSVKGIMENLYEIVEEVAESNNPEVMQIIQKYTHKMNELM